MIRAESKAPRQKARRRYVAILWCIMMLLFCASLLSEIRNRTNAIQTPMLVEMAFCMSLVLGGVSAGGMVKSFRGLQPLPLPEEKSQLQPLFEAAASAQSPAPAHLDERETRLRDRAHYTAYAVARWLTLALFSIYAALFVFHVAWANRIVPSFFFLLTWTVWGLPQSIILWSEPDMDESEPVPARPPVLSRRGWLEAVVGILFLAGLFALMLYAAYKM
jgi:hypothetical protein